LIERRQAQRLNLLKTSSEGKLALMEFIKEMWAFLRVKKKLWLAPIIAVMVLLGGLLVLAQGSVVAPFIYTLF
jgi:hypothetical protein